MSYNCQYDTYKGGRKREYRNEACYAPIFYREGGVDLVKVHHWLHHKDELDTANWFVENVINALAIPRVIEAYSYLPEWEKGVHISPEYAPVPWLTLVIDGTKMTPNDAYVLMCLFRYPQEYFQATQYCRDQMEKGDDVVTAYVNSHRHCDNSNHSILSYGIVSMAREGKRKSWKDWDLKKHWEDIAYDKKQGQYSKYMLSQNPNKGGNLTAYFTMPEIEQPKGYYY